MPVRRPAPGSINDPAPIPTSPWSAGLGLPPILLPRTPLLGRERDIATARNLLLDDDVPLVALIGPGGVGKTRLALQLAHDLAGHFGDGATFVDLAPTRDSGLVPGEIAQVLGIRDHGDIPTVDRLTSALRNRHVLLVLDNLEHLTEAAPLFARMLTACPNLTILVTSRAVLHVSGEHVIVVSPLLLPETNDFGRSNPLHKYSAIQLFVARAQAARSGFKLSEANAEAIVAICRSLDGLPLAIELAAARVAALSPAEVRDRLDRRLPFLTGGGRDAPARHQSMTATIAWSHDLLSQPDRVVFRRLAIFAGGFSLAAAETVTQSGDAPNLHVVDCIGSLVDQSLVVQKDNPHGHTRFLMLETVREYATVRLAESGEEVETRRRLADYVLTLSEERDEGVPQLPWLERIESDHDNIRAVLDWSIVRGDIETAQRLVAALWIYFWSIRGYFREGRSWADRTRALGSGSSPRLNLEVLFAASNLAWHSGGIEQSISLAREALAIARQSGDALLIGMALHHLAKAVADQPDLEDTVQLYEQALVHLAGAVTIDEQRTAAAATHNLAVETARRGDSDCAEILAARALERWREISSKWGTAGTLTMLADTARERGDPARAISVGQEALAICRDLQDKMILIDAVRVIAYSAANYPACTVLAARLLANANVVSEDFGIVAQQDEQAFLDRETAKLRTTLGDSRFSAAWAEGRAMPLEQAIADAMALGPSSSVVTDQPARHRITPRELDVLGLVAEGSSDREIAEVLFISRRTVNAHVASILARLDVPTRQAAVKKARETGLLAPGSQPDRHT